MAKLVYILISCIALLPSLVSASDVLVWQGQYYTGTIFNTGTYEFNFSVYDALTGGNICYSNTTNLTTGNFGEWSTEQYGVNSACNDTSKDYFLNININGIDQTPRRRLVVWNSLRKNVNEATTGILQSTSEIVAPIINATQVVAPIINATQVVAPIINATQVVAANTTMNYGFFGYIGDLVNRITKLFAQSIDVSGNVYASGNVTASHFIGDGSYLTGISGGGNPFNQSLNTTDSPTFSNLYVNNSPYWTNFWLGSSYIWDNGNGLEIDEPTGGSLTVRADNMMFLGTDTAEFDKNLLVYEDAPNALTVSDSYSDFPWFNVNTINGITTINGLAQLNNVNATGNLNVTGNLQVGGCIRYNCSQTTGCVTLGVCT